MTEHQDDNDDLDDGADVSASIDSLIAAQREVIDGIHRIIARIEQTEPYRARRATEPESLEPAGINDDTGDGPADLHLGGPLH